MPWFHREGGFMPREEVLALTRQAAEEALKRLNGKPRRVLLLPPDITRAHSGAGWIAEELYKFFSPRAEVYLIPTLGQHVPHTPGENRWMYGSVPPERILVHDWRKGVKTIGEVPAAFVKEVSQGKADWAIPVSLNRDLLEGGWDLIINVGHIVPHEVLGFANHNKNYFIGLGGKDMICASHMMAACCGIENNLGQLVTPLRHCYNKAERDYLSHLPDFFLQVVMDYGSDGKLGHVGFYAGDDLETYLMGARLSRQRNVTVVPPLKKVVAVMQADEFHSTWVANKAIYRTRKAMADGGELLIIAPGLERFGEQPEVDELIREFGYVGTPRVMELWKKEPLLQDLTHGTAHLIHGSSEGRFRITYAPGKLSEAEIKSVNFGYADLAETLRRYDPAKMKSGFNTMPDSEEVYFIATPSAGLWTTRDKLAAE